MMRFSQWGRSVLAFSCALFLTLDGQANPGSAASPDSPSSPDSPGTPGSPSSPDSVNSPVDPSDPKSLLGMVEKALRATNYRARLTYEQSGKLEVMEFSHGVIDGVEYEKVYFLNGENRALAKHGRPVDCATHGTTLLSGIGLPLPNGDIAKLEQSYSVDLLGVDRVAGRSAWVVQIIPADEFRHGMLFAIDQQSFLPLKALYIANGRKVLERLHFVSLETEVDFTARDFHGSEMQTPAECRGQKSTSPSNYKWKPEWVPPGFVLIGRDYSEDDGYMQTYTDGLASFSIFIKPLDQPETDPTMNLNTNLKKGATIIVMRVLSNEDRRIHASVLGEIPSDIAGRILSSVHYSLN